MLIEEDTKKKYRCNRCSKVLITLFNMRKHIESHMQIHKCETCEKEFQTRTQLSRHLLIHKLYDCPECSQKFPKTEIQYHRADEHGVPIPTCGICGYRTESRCTLLKHQRRVHMTEKTIPCPHCDMKFFENSSLNQHLIRHNPVKKYECKFCKKKFPRTETLLRHERIHTGEKKKVCNRCGEKFVQKASLNYHMMKRHPDAV
ncbi:hypothetical protein ABMA27_012804 [Loxostege sticticalis]|uniref:C2H2-type domain-containing protein n=1 Tax=Loxostege sticticalis TaxID=481309 RepID=A0ABR3GZU7_LOXSC